MLWVRHLHGCRLRPNRAAQPHGLWHTFHNPTLLKARSRRQTAGTTLRLAAPPGDAR